MMYSIKERINILKINALNSYRVQTAYFSENWASLGSTFFYSITLLLFIKILYSNINTFAGYKENEMILLIFVSQLNFYLDWSWSHNNLVSLIESVRTGDLDMVLLKPMPSLFYLTFRDISLINRLKDGIPNLIVLSFIIKWPELNLGLDRFLIALIIFVCGQITWHCFRFIFVLPVFFVGQSAAIYWVSGTLGEHQNIPLEGFKGKLRNIFTTIVPSLITAQMSVSVMLGKSDPFKMLILAVSVATIFVILKQIGWTIALKNYSSASS